MKNSDEQLKYQDEQYAFSGKHQRYWNEQYLFTMSIRLFTMSRANVPTSI